MADLSAEPSMEEILSSIKRIIAEEGEGTPQRRGRPLRSAPVPLAEDAAGDEEVLELSDPVPAGRPEPAPPADPAPPPARVEPRPAASPPPAVAPAVSAEPIVGQHAAAASRGALESLSRMLVKPEPGHDGTLEGLVRELLRPMLREWLDANLPGMVEALVAREIARIVGQGR